MKKKYVTKYRGDFCRGGGFSPTMPERGGVVVGGGGGMFSNAN